MTEQLHFHFSLSCIGEGNGNPLQCSCLENPRDGGAWWTAIYGVAQSQTRLKQLSSSSSSESDTVFGTRNIVGSGGKTDTIVREKYTLRGTAPEDALLSHCWGPLPQVAIESL